MTGDNEKYLKSEAHVIGERPVLTECVSSGPREVMHPSGYLSSKLFWVLSWTWIDYLP